MELEKAANRLHHLSMRYAGALMELVASEPVGLIPQAHPGLREARDLVDLILLTRAEVNALTACLVRNGAMKAEDYLKQSAEEYEWLAQQKAEFLGIEVTDHGIVIKVPRPG